ncbi:hydroxyethylthiazole kinase [Paenibacillus glucanolyticus]|jgi:hydroxyethylthiazole kinase|uniref:hydroxyethylthiazole kinase n=1 Tax=Paenibacillus TaxID=44249 RepID=UPI0003E286D5|nr:MULTISPECIES: hydroxyethylthiazole kinase [Paenibacillus]ANA81097.1 hydroxyethylthiazole kinase [Paenibacillus glucanolyticus]AVV54784.1 hydroxyethylthiazole kinase [Paenibacillus glucanolyticus]ETT33736.1 hydroxyethylthiazole kinase (4-methyl-5-beta-hydroxyethylthiazole kinase) [Paenibacillus sp. FSL R5-808]MPY18932.1 hydroxyethylthiazole kinase [Paenibacillus glucanolyticus]
MMIWEKEVSALLSKVQQTGPLVHNMTNVVVTNFTANGLYALGASPVMAYAPEEVADMAAIAGAVVLNIGTLNRELVDAMITAGQSANAHGVPILLDPVGAGATRFRTESAQRILREVKVSLVRGNAAEVAHLVGEAREIKGVDAGSSGDLGNAELAVRAARELDTMVVITGKEDVITDGTDVRIITGGHALLTKVTGAGCLLTSVLGAFAAVESNMLLAGTAGLAFYGAAASRAAERTADLGPGSFQNAFLDELSKLHPGSLQGYAAIREAAAAGGAR